MNYQEIITLEPGKLSGKPCIRGMRITVYDCKFFFTVSGLTNRHRFDLQSMLVKQASKKQKMIGISNIL
jgi:hypothetical protein